MPGRLLAVAVVFFLAGAALPVVGGPRRTPNPGAFLQAGERVEVRFQGRPAAARSYEGRIKDVRPAWGVLILTVGKGKEARDLRFDIGEARIVGPDGDEWKGQDLRVGDRVRVQLTADGRLVQQVSELAD
jgi:3-dehydroquinate synthase class II